MRFSIQKAALMQAIQTVSKAVAVRTTKQVLSGILLDVRDQEIIATAYDLELGIQTRIVGSEDNQLKIEQPGSIVLPARYFSEVIRKLPDTVITMQVANNYMTEISTASVQFHLHGIDAEEFPKLPSFVGVQGLQVQSSMLGDLIRTTAFATANTEVRPILTGINIQCANDKLTFTATDGLRLATHYVTLTDAPKWQAVIPGKSLIELTKILASGDDIVELYLTESHSLFVSGDTRFYTRLIDGTYPDTSRIIPNGHKTEVIVPGDDLLGAIDRAALIARDRDNHMVRLELENTVLTVSSNSPEIGNVSETVESEQKTGDDLQIAFNARYVLDALRALDAAQLTIRFNGSTQAFVIEKTGDKSVLQLISPVLWR
ncbi:DNA polymerase III subunit beta [Alicyclobacillus dauci]|uniref:Beta sliding clamp n=1 Tax=Alicyclobacillus dauci TaxID=1475485 RepID=A0ABY6Z4R8_9BACL|nr:DNA polymerase III subunit beta [Alicyclobacillus dauci]WAH37010.1 DNA polymerase III subunit beta [Alicyclobacillus dauci]